MSTEEFQGGFSSLERGNMYPIISVERTEAKFNGKANKGMKLIILDDDVKLATYLPSKLTASISDDIFA